MSARFLIRGDGTLQAISLSCSSQRDRPFMSSPFAHPIPQSYRRAREDLFRDSLSTAQLSMQEAVPAKPSRPAQAGIGGTGGTF